LISVIVGVAAAQEKGRIKPDSKESPQVDNKNNNNTGSAPTTQSKPSTSFFGKLFKKK
jgi:hypothetical protein